MGRQDVLDTESIPFLGLIIMKTHKATAKGSFEIPSQGLIIHCPRTEPGCGGDSFQVEKQTENRNGSLLSIQKFLYPNNNIHIEISMHFFLDEKNVLDHLIKLNLII